MSDPEIKHIVPFKFHLWSLCGVGYLKLVEFCRSLGKEKKERRLFEVDEQLGT